jgi:membrane-bound ClpP family serine protease
MTLRKIIKFFDRLEDKIRGKLSHYPIFYAFIGGIGVVLFWRGVWHTADDMNMGSVISLIIGGLILLLTGVFVSAFIGSRLIISGLIGEKKLTEKEQMEIETEEAQLKNIHSALSKLEKKLDHVETHLETEIEKIEKSKQI